MSRLGVPPGTEALPAVTECPRCRGPRLYTYQDTLFGGEWHSCRDCGAAGGSVALAAAVWGSDPADAAAALGLDPDAAAEYAACPADAGAALRAADLGLGRARALAERLGLTAGHWADRLGRFVVPAARDAVDAICRSGGPPAAQPPLRRDWGDLLVVPFEDVPGRTVGVWAVNPDDGSSAYAPVRATWPARESGLGLLGALDGGHDPDFGSTVFLVADPLLALRLQDRRFRTSTRPLPAAACFPAAGRVARLDSGVLYGRRAVVWGPRVTRELVRQARLADARVAGPVWGPDPAAALDKTGPRTVLRRVEEKAVPWIEALAALLAEAPPAEADATVRFVGVRGDDLARLAAFGGAAGEAAVRAGGVDPDAPLSARDPSGTRLVERGGCWFAVDRRRGERLVTDAPFRIRQVIHMPDRGDEMYYRVVARHRGREVEFVTPAAAFDADPFARVRAEVARAGVGLPVHCRPAYARVAGAAAVLRAPEHVTVSDRCGWNESRAAWVFPGFSVTARGEVGPGTLLPPDRLTPGQAAEPPGPLSPDALAALGTEGPAGAVVWAAAGCVVANLVAPALARPVSGVALVGAGAAEAGWEAARLLGCAEITLAAGPRADLTAERLRTAAAAHEWPLLIRQRRDRRNGHASFIRETVGVVTQLHPLVAAVVGFSGGWHAVRLAGRCRLPGRPAAAALAVLAASFLRWFAAGGMRLTAGDHGPAVFAALADWFEAAGGRRSAVEAGATLVAFDRGGRDAADRVRDLIRAASAETPHPRAGGPRATAPAGPGRVEVRYHAIDFWSYRHGVTAPPPDVVGEALAAADAVADVDSAGRPRWEVAAGWLNAST